ncbi:MAG: universal stress protein [Bacteroidetes bacterium]|jgi:nucleotide-binding universal stress UspA family protein|nr:universal stress protein [Bacteroidota bacterium]MBS1980407.1 universal stress protein [Bacteroidota bacterium]
MDKGILCAIDFSAPSKSALRWSVELAKDLHIPLTLLYAYRLQKLPHDQAIEYKKQVDAEARQKFLKLEKEFLVDKGIDYDFKSEVGFIADRVKDHASKNETKFFVVDQKTSMANKESFDELLKKVNVPLVIVP